MPAARATSLLTPAGAALALAAALASQSVSAAPSGATLVIARTVEPRVAYRGVPVEQLPPAVSVDLGTATQVFGTVGAPGVAATVDEAGLQDVGVIAGQATGGLAARLLSASEPGLRPVPGAGHAAAVPMLGAASGVGSTVTAATRNVGTLVQGALAPLIPVAGDR